MCFDHVAPAAEQVVFNIFRPYFLHLIAIIINEIKAASIKSERTIFTVLENFFRWFGLSSEGRGAGRGDG